MLLFAVCGLLVGSSVTVELPMEARCTGTEVELGEIATIRSDDLDLAARVEAIEIGYAPSPGYSRVIRSDRLEQLLTRRMPDVEFHFRGHGRTRVEPTVAKVPAEDLVSTARAELDRVFGPLEAEFSQNRVVQAIDVPASESGWRLRARPGSIVRPTSGVFTVPVEVYVDGTLYRIVQTSWRAEVFETRSVLARTVRAGDTLTPDMFEARRVRVTSYNDRSPLPPAFLEKAVANRNLAPGETVQGSDVYRAAVVQQGARLQLMVTKGRIRATVAAEALHAGAIGESIRVKNLLTEEHLTAVVKSRDLVEIDITQ